MNLINHSCCFRTMTNCYWEDRCSSHLQSPWLQWSYFWKWKKMCIPWPLNGLKFYHLVDNTSYLWKFNTVHTVLLHTVHLNQSWGFLSRISGNCCAGVRCDDPGCRCLFEHADNVPDCLNLLSCLASWCCRFEFANFMIVKRIFLVLLFFLIKEMFCHVWLEDFLNILILALRG